MYRHVLLLVDLFLEIDKLYLLVDSYMFFLRHYLQAPINVPVSADKFWLLTKDRAFSLPSPFDNKGNYIIR